MEHDVAKAVGDLCCWLSNLETINGSSRTKCTDKRAVIHVQKHKCSLQFPQGALAVVLCSLIVSFFSQTGWLAPSPWSVRGPMVMNVFPFLWSPLYCYSMPGRMKNRLKRQETDTERMFGCWLLSYQPFSHLMKQLSALRLIKYPPDAGQSCRVARPWEGNIRF